MIPPKVKNGPKGIVCPNFFLPKINSIRPAIDPVKKASIKTSNELGSPKTKPIKTASFKSPPPIPLPLVKIIKLAKKVASKKAPKIPRKKEPNIESRLKKAC